MKNDPGIFSAQLNLATKRRYTRAIKKLGWSLISWDDNPLKKYHYTEPVHISVFDKHIMKKKEFLILKLGNSITLAVVRARKENRQILIFRERKGTGIVVNTMIAGHFEKGIDNDLIDTVTREANEEIGFKIPQRAHFYIDTRPSIPIPNNCTTTISTAIIEVPSSWKPRKGRFVDLRRAPLLLDHTPARVAAFIACAYYNIIPDIGMSTRFRNPIHYSKKA